MDFDMLEKLSEKDLTELYELYEDTMPLSCWCCSGSYLLKDVSPGNACNSSLANYCASLLRKYNCSFGEYKCDSAVQYQSGGGINCR